MKKILLGMLLLIATTFSANKVSAQAQESHAPKSAPIPLEVFFGSESWTSQLVIDKNFAGSNKLGYFALSYIKANYDNDVYLRESVNLAMLKYSLCKNVSVLSGALINSHWGFRPYAGGQYAYHSRTFMGMVTSGFHLTETKNFETIAMAEYRPAIQGDWSLYTRVQGMYSQNTVIGEHDRSHMYTRAGVSYKAFSFGLGLNYDWYGFGPMKIEDQQWGIFISTLL